MNKTFFKVLGSWFLVLGLALVIASRATAQPYDSTTLQTPLVDASGNTGFPLLQTFNSLQVSNYAGYGIFVSVLPATSSSNVQAALVMTNYLTLAGFTIHTNGHFTAYDQYGTKFRTGTNGVLEIRGTNGMAFTVSNGVVTAGSFAGTTLAANISGLTNYVLLTQFSNTTTYLQTNAAASLQSVSNGLAAFTQASSNSVLTNLSAFTIALVNSTSNNLATNSALSATTSNSLVTQFTTLTMNASNVLAVAGAADTVNWQTASNNVAVYAYGVSNAAIAYTLGVSNVQATFAVNAATTALNGTNYSLTVSNALKAYITGVSNLNSPSKAFTAALAAGFTSQGQGFNAPLMPDGNFSVSLVPQDAPTAASAATNHWYVGGKSASGYTIYVPVQNPFPLNFDSIIKENTQ